MEQRVFVLGAGASKPAGSLLMNELLPEALGNQYIYNQFNTIGGDVIADCNSVVEFLETRFGQSLKPRRDGIYLQDTPLAIFCASHDAEALLRDIEEISDPNYKSKVTTAFTRLIYRTLQPPNLKNSSNCYPKFAVQIEKFLPQDQITIISFNYDTLLERALLDRGSTPNLASSFSYLVSFSKVRKWHSYLTNYNGKLELLKLHGSFNWSDCHSCGSLSLCWFQRIDDIGKTRCHKCSATYMPLLVAPIASKSVQGGPWDRLWERAAQALMSCWDLTLIGYSLRDAQARELFKKALKSNHTLEKITVVDPNADSLATDLGALLGRQARISFCIFESFERYVQVNC